MVSSSSTAIVNLDQQLKNQTIWIPIFNMPGIGMISISNFRYADPYCILAFNKPTWQGIVKVPDEVVPVVFRQGHERATHHNELNLVYTVAQLLQLEQNKVACFLTMPFTLQWGSK